MTRPYGGRQAPAGRWRMGTATAKDVALRQETLVLRAETAVLFLEGGDVAAAGKGLFALGFESLLPVADQVVIEAQGAGRFGDRVALLGNELDGLRLELGGVGTSRSGHDGPPSV